jgi:hypothetical protein
MSSAPLASLTFLDSSIPNIDLRADQSAADERPTVGALVDRL